MKLNRVLIIFKGIARHGKRRPMYIGSSYLKGHAAAIAEISKALDELHIPYDVIQRDCLSCALKADLIVTIGGDGTFLAATHFAGDTPILSVNSMPGYSVGFFCAARVKDFKEMMMLISGDRLRPIELPTIEARISGRRVHHTAVNDVLFMTGSPAEMARYSIRIDPRTEHQRSSGIWMSTGAGSTAGILSAGGKKYPLGSKRIQYLVREPCAQHSKGYRLLHGTIGPRQSIAIVPERDSVIYIDGPGISYPVRRGQRLSVGLSNKTVKVFICL